MMRRLGLFILACCFGSAGFGADASLRKATFLPQWEPQAQFAGYYVAYEKGIYKKHNIDVTILRGGPVNPPCEALETGKADFATMFLSTALAERDKGLKICNIGQIVQKSALLLIAKKASGIETPLDFAGKRIGIWPDFAIQPQALFRKFNVEVESVTQTFTMNILLSGAVDVASAMWYNEYHVLMNSGLEEEDMQVFFFSNYDLNFPEDGIYCREETLKNDCELCKDFVAASLEGWKYTFANPDEALDIVMKYVREANLPTNRVHQKWMLTRMKDLILPLGDKTAMGKMAEEDFQTVVDELLKSGIITYKPTFSEFYENCATLYEETKPGV
ncbi:MAG: ABC transporter substrate-binding protein [Candidatus Omnitrophota bacterium]|jgi:NitT/TauT family transport system substrate-binding protein|nr:MAG: ABC transporter substrate-binding protein [Candidatus Omnitrophota bacterium]